MTKILNLGAPKERPYEPLGRLINVVYAFELCKDTIPHSKEINIDLLKAIAESKRYNKTLYGS